MAAGNHQLAKRIGTAVVAGPLVTWLILSGVWPALILFSLAAGIAAGEFARLGLRALTFEAAPAVVAAAVLPLLVGLGGLAWAPAVFAALLVVAWSWQALRGDAQEGALRAAQVVQAALFGTLGPTALAFLRVQPSGGQWVIALLAATWLNDAGAFFVGWRFGKHKLAPAVSPNKSWEGLAGGAITGAAFTFGLGLTVLREVPGWGLVVIAVVSATLGPLGDLSKSLLKRASKVKDSGGLLPGHGGMLDRIDALSFNAAAVALAVALRAALLASR